MATENNNAVVVGKTPSSIQQLYKRLPKEEDEHSDDAENTDLNVAVTNSITGIDHDDLDDLLRHDEESSLVAADASSSDIFRRNNNKNSSWKNQQQSGTAAAKMDGSGSSCDGQEQVAASSTTSNTTTISSSTAPQQPLHLGATGIQNRGSSNSHKSYSSSENGGGNDGDDGDDDDDDSDDDDWDDDDFDNEAGLRRYHFADQPHGPDGERHRNGSNSASGDIGRYSVFHRLAKSLAELRAAARQRTAARLLTMPSESFGYRLQACLVTWFCDATDRGILLAAALLLGWVVVGLAANPSGAWWWGGIALFCVRISARRAYEQACLAVRGGRSAFLPLLGRIRRQQRQRVRTSEADIGVHPGDAAAGSGNGNNNAGSSSSWREEVRSTSLEMV